MSLFKRFTPNLTGRDFATGDVHGNFTYLQQALDDIGFNPEHDRLFQCGDLVDRGPESHLAIEWLAKPWFHAVRGNHDDYVCRFDTCDTGNWISNGGLWFSALSRDEQLEHQVQFREMPIAIEVQTPDGMTFGIVHAECPRPDWSTFARELEGAHNLTGKQFKCLLNSAMWCRNRFENRDRVPIEGIDYVLVGHQPIQRGPVMIGNTLYLDTMGWRAGGAFSFLNMTERTMVLTGRAL